MNNDEKATSTTDTKAQAEGVDKDGLPIYQSRGTGATVREVDAESILQDRDSVADEQARARSRLRWGVAPSGDDFLARRNKTPPPDHPVHKIPMEEQEKMRKKGINPVLKAEMDEAMYGSNKSKSFLGKIVSSGFGGHGVR